VQEVRRRCGSGPTKFTPASWCPAPPSSFQTWTPRLAYWLIKIFCLFRLFCTFVDPQT